MKSTGVLHGGPDACFVYDSKPWDVNCDMGETEAHCPNGHPYGEICKPPWTPIK